MTPKKTITETNINWKKSQKMLRFVIKLYCPPDIFIVKPFSCKVCACFLLLLLRSGFRIKSFPAQQCVYCRFGLPAS